MSWKFTLAASAILSLCGPASAQLLVIGSGDAQACYQEAKSGNEGDRSAVRLCERALSEHTVIGKDRIYTHVNMGILLMRGGAYEAALNAFDDAISMDAALTEAHINRGACQIFMGKPSEAVDTLTTGISLGKGHPHLADALYNRAIAYESLENFNAAYADLQHAQSLRPEWDQLAQMLERYSVVSN